MERGVDSLYTIEDEDQHHSSLRTGQENDGGLEMEKRHGMIYILDHTYTDCWGHNGLQRDENGSRETNEATPGATRREDSEGTHQVVLGKVQD